MLVSKTVYAERVFSIYVTEDDGETWKVVPMEFSELRNAIGFCNENTDKDSIFIVVPSDRTEASVKNVL